MSTETIEVLKKIATSERPALAADCALKSINDKIAPSCTQLGQKHGVSRQAVARHIRAFRQMIPQT
jgi:hypothetical protein